MNDALKLPGLSNAWTMPIKGRIDMLTTGIRTPVGLKISGANLVQIEQIGGQVEVELRRMKATRSVFAERTGGGYFLDFDWNRDELARYGLSMDQAQEAVLNAIGGENVTTTIQGRERYPVNVRYSVTSAAIRRPSAVSWCRSPGAETDFLFPTGGSERGDRTRDDP